MHIHLLLFKFYTSVTFEAKTLPLALWIPQKNRVATAYLSSANQNLPIQENSRTRYAMQNNITFLDIRAQIVRLAYLVLLYFASIDFHLQNLGMQWRPCFFGESREEVVIFLPQRSQRCRSYKK